MTNTIKTKNQEYRELGYKASEEENYDLAIEYFKKAVEVLPNDWDSYNNIGNNLSKRGLSYESIGYFDKCLELFSKHDKARKNKAIAYMSVELNRLAKIELEKHIKVHPKDLDAYTLLGMAEFECKNYNKAIKHYTKVIKMGSKLSEYELMHNYKLRQCAYEKVGDFKNAEKDKEIADSLLIK